MTGENDLEHAFFDRKAYHSLSPFTRFVPSFPFPASWASCEPARILHRLAQVKGSAKFFLAAYSLTATIPLTADTPLHLLLTLFTLLLRCPIWLRDFHRCTLPSGQM